MSNKLYNQKKRILLTLFGLLLVSIQLASAAPGNIERVSVDSNGNEGNGSSFLPSISGDGRFVAFESRASNLVSDGINRVHIFVHDRQTGTTSLVSVDSSGIQGNTSSEHPSISNDGRFVAFKSGASNLVHGDTNGVADIFVHDRQVGTTSRVSVDSSGSQGNDDSYNPSISGDGRFVAFESDARNLVSDDTNGRSDIFVHDRQTGITSRVSVDSSGIQGNQVSLYPSISGDGRFVAFASWASNLVSGDTNGTLGIFVHDRQIGTTSRVSVDSSGNEGNGHSYNPSISGDGRFVAFRSYASNLVSGDTNGSYDVFVHDRQTGTTSRVSVDSSGNEGNGSSHSPSISGDGRFVAFSSEASNLISSDTSGTFDIFVHDRQTGTTSRVSVNSSGNEGNGGSGFPSISGDSHFIAFQSSASNLVSGDNNNTGDIFVAEQAVTDPNAASCDPASGFNAIYGTPGNDKLQGTPGNDIIIGYGGNDRLEGLGGNDCLIGGPGNDQLYGGEGNDILWGGELDNSTVYDSQDRDKLYGNDGDDEMHGGGDKDRLDGNNGDDAMYGDDGDDTMVGHKGDDTLYGGNGRDNMRGDDGGDMMYGEAGDDRLYGRQGNDTLDGGDDNDQLDGSAGTDTCIDGEKLKSCEL
ncbi:MAG: PD40 domain-containing protein [Ardenticatenaceae bacterium]|nr:PD40 domain-containing protein [Ardenticatenaceae bacterium]